MQHHGASSMAKVYKKEKHQVAMVVTPAARKQLKDTYSRLRVSVWPSSEDAA